MEPAVLFFPLIFTDRIKLHREPVSKDTVTTAKEQKGEVKFVMTKAMYKNGLAILMAIAIIFAFTPILPGVGNTAFAAKKLGAPVSFSGKAMSSKQIKLTWSKVEGAKSYMVYRSGKKIATVKKATFTDKKVKKNKVYTYQVMAKNGAKSWKVTVKANKTKGNVKSIKLNASELTITSGKSEALKATLTPAKGLTSKKIVWTTSDNTVAAVSNTGEVTGAAAGEAVITARSANGLQASCAVTVKEASPYADTILTNGKIYTQDAKSTIAEAVAIKDGQFVYVGAAGTDELQALTGPETDVQDLGGKMVTPSFIDAHTHPEYVAHDRTITIGWTYDIEEMLAECKAYIDAHPENPFYEFRYYPSDLATKNNMKTLEADMLDVLGDVPVKMYDFSDHSCWFNNTALKYLKIDKNTPDPAAPAEICRYKDVFTDEECAAKGHDPMDPTGVFNEAGSYSKYMSNLYDKIQWKPNPNLEEDQWQGLVDYYHSVGVAGVGDAIIGSEENLKLLSDMDKEGKLNTYFNCMTYGEYGTIDETIAQMKKWKKKYETENVKIDTMKYFFDGTNEIGTSSVIEPFEAEKAGTDDFYGYQECTTEQLTEMMLKLNDAGFDLHIHLVGDRAFRSACDATEAAQAACAAQGKEWKMQVELAHCELIHPDDATRPAELGIVVNWSPHWTGGYFGDEAREWLGNERFDSMYNFQPMIKAGAVVNFGSDVVSQYEFHRASPVFGMQCALTRIDPEYPMDPEIYPNSMRPAETSKFTMDQMIKGYTLNGAIQFRIDDQTGSIEVGKNADLTIWTQNLYDVNENELSKATVDNTMFKGKFVYSR